jgi:hypothetical protein
MNEDPRKELWLAQTSELYRSIGEFVVKFERVCYSLTMGIMAMLERSGLRDQQISNVFLAGLTAEPIRTLFESLAAQTDWLKTEERGRLKTLLLRFQKLTSERNDVVHGTWLIDFYNYASHAQDFSTAFGMKLHKNKNGVATKSFERTVEDFAILINEADKLRADVDRLCGRFIFDSNGNQVAFLAKPAELED